MAKHPEGMIAGIDWKSRATLSWTAARDKPRERPRAASRGVGANARRRAARAHAEGRLLYETAARTDEVLRLNVEDLDVAGKRARTRSNGGDTDWLFFGSAIAFVSGAAPRLRALRRRGVRPG